VHKNKGFTIAELTMVLVVIGILVTLYFNMEQIYLTARVKQETLKINRFEKALMTYFLKSNGENPPAVSAGDTEIDAQAFFDMGLLVESDFDAPLAGAPWSMHFGYTGSNADGSGGWMENKSTSIKTIGVELFDPSAVLPCIIEKSMDDLDMQNGRGRIINSGANFDENEYKDCYDITTTAYNGMNYGYMIHRPRLRGVAPTP
jgi:prepilin-type N-terminal cleavage/methylation domain-containing protein